MSGEPALFETGLILDLCGGTGGWSKPYSDAGYNVRVVDIRDHPLNDVRWEAVPEMPVHGILAAPPCTDLASSGARWWTGKGQRALNDALAVADACLRLVALCRPEWWALENPVGRLSRFYGPPQFAFDPCDFGDPYTKRTHLWGSFTIPELSPVAATEGSKMHLLPPSSDRQALRSETPAGFARAFFEVNP